MALTPEEQAELESLSADSTGASNPKGLSDSEAEELKMLQKDKSIGPEELAKFQKNKDISDAVVKGVTSGATLGGQGVLGGAIQAGLDLGQKGLNKMGLASPSPTQVSSQLAKQGATGDVGPTSDKDLYYQGKHETQDARTGYTAHVADACR